MHFNEHADFYYQLAWGDKETFHFAFLVLDRAYSIIPYAPIDKTWFALYQHDHLGKVIFQHRCGDKWSWFGSTRSIDGFAREAECLEILRDLRERVLATRGLPRKLAFRK
jgi:hypothetical protein